MNKPQPKRVGERINWQKGDLAAIEHVTTWMGNRSAGVKSGQSSVIRFATVVKRIKDGPVYVPSVVRYLDTDVEETIARHTTRHGVRQLVMLNRHDMCMWVADYATWTEGKLAPLGQEYKTWPEVRAAAELAFGIEPAEKV